MIIDKLIESIKAKQNPSVVGIDTAFSYLPEERKKGITNNEEACSAIYSFNKEIIDSIYDIVPAVKVQVAYYESYGVSGMKVFRDTMDYARQKGMIVIADIKRNDIGATSKAYSSAYIGTNDIDISAEFNSDMITLNGYLGSDGINPFLDDCKKYDRGGFVLVKTSNPSSSELQNLVCGDKLLYQIMGDLVALWGKEIIGEYGYSSLGAVVGATHKSEAKTLRKALPSLFFLVPGYGVQGGLAADLTVCFDDNGLGAIVNSSRGIICAYQKMGLSVGESARQASLIMRDDIVGALIEQGKTKWLD